MPEISEQDFQDLKDQVQALANQLNQARNRIDELEDFATDHIGLDWGESLVDINAPHPNISVNTIESGGGTIRQDANGMQVASKGALTGAIYFGELLVPDPADVIPLVFEGSYSTEDGGGQIRMVADGTSPLPETYVSASAVGTLRTARLQALDETAAVVAEGITGSRARISFFGSPRFKSDLSPTQIVGNVDNYDPNGNYGAAVFRLSTDASRDVTGIVPTNDGAGRILILFNVGGFNIVLKDESASSTAAYRLALAADITLAPDNSALLWYDGTSARWRCVARYT